jgi:hypothetical protein
LKPQVVTVLAERTKEDENARKEGREERKVSKRQGDKETKSGEKMSKRHCPAKLLSLGTAALNTAP